MENKKYKKIKFTGERMLNRPESMLYKISMERYKFAGHFTQNKHTLDMACGSGYGSNFLAENASNVIGVDIDIDTINYCKETYKKNNLIFLLSEKDKKIDNFTNNFDVIVSFETIEHTEKYKDFLNNLKTYLKEAGTIIISTPNNFKKKYPPENEFHVYEFDILELYELIKVIFDGYRISLFGQCKTNIKRSDEIKKEKNFIKKFIPILIKKVYDFDRKHLYIIRKIEHLKLYKSLSSLQDNFKNDINVYRIDEKEDFFNPLISIIIIEK